MTALQRLAANLWLDPGSVTLEYDGGWRIRGTCVRAGETKRYPEAAVRSLGGNALPSLALALILQHRVQELMDERAEHLRRKMALMHHPEGAPIYPCFVLRDLTPQEWARRRHRVEQADAQALDALVRLASLLGIDPEDGATTTTTNEQGSA
jgi:hypothetical protein